MDKPFINAAVFLDRDGTLIRDLNYLGDIEKVEILPGVIEALRQLKERGFRLFMVTNQSGVARGFFTFEQTLILQKQIMQLFAAKGVDFDDFRLCPHYLKGTVAEFTQDCACRKPKPGMLTDLAIQWQISLTHSFMIGDKLIDVEAGNLAGCRGILVKTGRIQVDNIPPEVASFESLLAFVTRIKEFSSK